MFLDQKPYIGHHTMKTSILFKLIIEVMQHQTKIPVSFLVETAKVIPEEQSQLWKGTILEDSPDTETS